MTEFALAHEVVARLQTEVGLSHEPLREAVSKGVDAQMRCTRLHPPSSPGYYRWAEAHVALRQGVAPLGWKPSDRGNFSTIVRPDGLVAITIATGDSRTGKEGRPVPTTKYPRGAMTQAAVRVNQQLSLDMVSGGVILPPEAESVERVTWWLLLAGGQGEVRMELSCPRHINEHGYIDSWSERIILEPLEIEGALPMDGDELAMEAIDVPVERR
jgi:hypothetical protein